MEGQADILQQRIEPQPFDSRDRQALEWIRGEQQEGIETQRDEALRRQCRLHGPLGQAPFQQGNQATCKRHDRNPQKHRAFMVAPCSGDLEDQRLHRMRILSH